MLRLDTDNLQNDQILLAGSTVKPISLEGTVALKAASQKHYLTTFVGKVLPDSATCECCGKKYQKQPIGVCFSVEEIGYLGCGIPLYLSFMKLCLAVALLSSLVVAAPSLYFNYTGGSCDDSSNVLHCSKTLFLSLSVANKISQSGELTLQSYLISGNVVLVFLLLLFMRRWMTELQMEIDLAPSPSDYAVLLKMPDSTYRQKDVRQAIGLWFHQQMTAGVVASSPMLFKCKKHFPVEKIIVSYDLTTFRGLEKELQHLTNEIKLMVPSPGGTNVARRIARVDHIKDLIANKSFVRNKTCLVLFSYPQQQRFLLSRYQYSFFEKMCCCEDDPILYNDNKIDVKRAPIPNDVAWANHSTKASWKLRARWLIKLGCFMAMLGVGGLIIGLLYMYFNYRKQSPIVNSFICPLISLVISLVNSCLYKLFSHLNELEKQPTLLEERVSSACRLTALMFVNSGAMLLIAYLIADLGSIWVYNGFVDTISYSFLFSIVLPQLYKYFSIDVLRGWHQRTKARKSGFPPRTTQQEANKIFQRPYCRTEDMYIQVINQIWWCSLFAPIVPLGYPCVLLSLFIGYWLEKINIVHVYRQPVQIGSYLNEEMTALLEFCMVLMSLGNLAFDLAVSIVTGNSMTVGVIVANSVAVVLAFTVYLVPRKWLDKITSVLLCCRKQRMFLNIEYDIALQGFSTTYEQQNPLYRYDVVDKQRAIEDNLEVEMESLAQELHDTLKKVHQEQHHPLHTALTKVQEEEEKVMYASITYPEKIVHRSERKNSMLNIPSLRQYFDEPNLQRQTTFPVKPSTDRLVDFTVLVQGLDECQKGQVLNRVLSTLKQINKKK